MGGKDFLSLTSLTWTHPRISWDDEIDGEVRHLVGLPLTSLGLADARYLTDAGLECLKGLPLTQLDLSRCNCLTQASLGILRSFSELRLLKMPVIYGEWLDHVPEEWEEADLTYNTCNCEYCFTPW